MAIVSDTLSMTDANDESVSITTDYDDATFVISRVTCRSTNDAFTAFCQMRQGNRQRDFVIPPGTDVVVTSGFGPWRYDLLGANGPQLEIELRFQAG